MQRKIVIAGLVLLALSTWPAVGLAQTFLFMPRVGMEINYWLSELDGEVQIAKGTVVGTTIDFDDDLGLDDNEGIPELSFWYEFEGGSRLSLSYLQAEHNGNNTLTRTITFHGIDYLVSTTVSSELKTKIWELTDEIPLLEDEEGKSLGLLLGVKYLTFDVDLSSPGTSDSRSLEVPLPEIGLTGSMDMGNGISLKGRISGVSLKISDAGGTMVDVRLGAGYRLNENWNLSLLYRYFDLNGEADDDEANFSLQGPMLSVVGYF